jgi:hypothetical protein
LRTELLLSPAGIDLSNFLTLIVGLPSSLVARLNSSTILLVILEPVCPSVSPSNLATKIASSNGPSGLSEGEGLAVEIGATVGDVGLVIRE